MSEKHSVRWVQSSMGFRSARVPNLATLRATWLKCQVWSKNWLVKLNSRYILLVTLQRVSFRNFSEIPKISCKHAIAQLRVLAPEVAARFFGSHTLYCCSGVPLVHRHESPLKKISLCVAGHKQRTSSATSSVHRCVGCSRCVSPHRLRFDSTRHF